jgi:tetratricopeptide (TPR) repeat protein
LKTEADSYLKKANELSPKRQEILVEWMKTDLYNKKYEETREKGEKCIGYNLEYGECYWMMYLTYLYLGDEKKAEEYYETAKEKKYPVNTNNSLLQMVNVYIEKNNYEKLTELYETLLEKEPEKIEYHASLAVCYKKLGRLQEAEKEALKIFELSPESKEAVEKFLQELY